MVLSRKLLWASICKGDRPVLRTIFSEEQTRQIFPVVHNQVRDFLVRACLDVYGILLGDSLHPFHEVEKAAIHLQYHLGRRVSYQAAQAIWHEFVNDIVLDDLKADVLV